MKRNLTLLVILILIALLAACQGSRPPEPLELASALHGAWEDPLTRWVYTFAEDGAYLGKAPPLADGVNRIAGVYLLDDEGYLEFTLAQPAPRRGWTFYERHNVWQVQEITDEHLLLVCGRDRVRLVRR